MGRSMVWHDGWRAQQNLLDFVANPLDHKPSSFLHFIGYGRCGAFLLIFRKCTIPP
jgi:hypothetical protein